MVLLTSDSDLVTTFKGYCFKGPDLIIGPEGEAEYYSRNGNRVTPGNDGCYITLYKAQNDRWRIGVDGRGLHRIFIYQRNGRWAIGNSLYKLVSYLRENGADLSPNFPNIESYRTRKNFTLQQQTSKTIFDEIRLVPSFRMLEYHGKEWYEVERAPTFAEDYEAGMYSYLKAMQDRAATLLHSSEMFFEVDLSGGLDSRAVLSFLLRAGIKDICRSRYRIVSTVSLVDDFRVAKRVAGHLGLELNGPSKPRSVAASQDLGFYGWRDTSLGVYTPPYFHFYPLDVSRLKAHGAGGGNSRRINRHLSFGRMLDSYSDHFTDDNYDAWREEVLVTMRDLQTSRPYVNPFLLHYREFRNRFHFGHEPQSRLMFTPLNTSLIDAFMDQNPGRTNHQFFYDVMENNVSGLSVLPYDEESKSPSNEEREAVLNMRLPEPVAGNCYGTDSELTKSPEADLKAKVRWLDLAASALNVADSRDLFDSQTVVKARAALSALRSEKVGLKTHSPLSILLSFVILKRFALDSTFEIE